jgi:hypothetical protein
MASNASRSLWRRPWVWVLVALVLIVVLVYLGSETLQPA